MPPGRRQIYGTPAAAPRPGNAGLPTTCGTIDWASRLAAIRADLTVTGPKVFVKTTWHMPIFNPRPQIRRRPLGNDCACYVIDDALADPGGQAQ